MLLDAIRRVVRASTTIVVYAIVVDARNERARAFYERYGFRAFAGAPRRLFAPSRAAMSQKISLMQSTQSVRTAPTGNDINEF